MPKQPKPKVRYWIRFHWSECVLCGKDDNWRERVYTAKPKDVAKRNMREPDWACSEHFM